VRADPRLPGTVLVGFLGSGKTTLLNHLLSAPHGHKLAVIVNDFAELNVDARLVRRADARLVEMTNGCICCTLREDLLEELRALSEVEGLDGVLVESTGIGEPLPIAQTFYMEDLPERVRLDCIVTVVDAGHFWADYGRTDVIEDAEGNPLESPLAPLLVDQLEFTNVVLLNKADRASADELGALEGFVRQLNPRARVYRAEYGRLGPSLLLNTGLYDYEAGMEAEDWDLEWAKSGSEAEAYGFTSFVYRSDTSFMWERFLALFDAWPEAVVRAKGFVVFEDAPPALLSLAGEDVRVEALEAEDGEDLGEVGPTEIVLIGRNLPERELRRMLDACRAPSGTHVDRERAHPLV